MEREGEVLFSRLVAQMHTLWKQELLCDIHLHVQDRVIAAHRVVLAALSPYFRAMFCSQLNESHQPTVTIQGFSYPVIYMIVEYAYTADIPLNEDNVQNILHVASVMQIESLEHLCTQFLAERLNPSNCLGIRELAQSFGCYDLQTKADSFCEDNFSKVSQNEEFLKLSANQVINLVARDALKVRTEEEVYTAVIGWLEYAAEERAEDMVKIMEKVRLPLVRWEFLMGKVRNHKLFTNNDQCRQYLQQARAFQASSYHPDLNNFAFNEAVLLAQPRIGYGATDFLYAVGGETTNRELITMVEGYNPVSNKSTELSAMPTARRSLGILIVDNMIFAVGGSDKGAAVSTVEVFDIETGVWKTRASLCRPRTSVAAAVLEGQVFAVGGHDGQRALSSAEMYDSDTDCWNQTAELQTPRSMASSVCLKNRLYVLGGYDGEMDLRSAEKLDSRLAEWLPIASMHDSRSMCGAAVLDDKILVAGGSSGAQCLSSVEMYNPSSDQWTVLQPLTSPRRGLGLAVIGGAVYAAGGHDGKKYLNSVEKFNMYDQGWTVVGYLAECRGRFGFA
ncbi:kelch-like protein 18 [Littorina saxatilis]|uniref:BTB domain-containing protein n=1 Tax=Littorina saxatilis TaxID=31220 RepID=A0AAN9BPA1_9CAEN